jgi:hypothetical protein
MSTSRKCIRIATRVVPMLVVAGCITPPSSRGGRWTIGGDDLDPRRERSLEREPANAPYMSRKVVSGKEAPSRLIAADGHRCTVTARRFGEVREGDKVTCRWSR